MKSEDGRTRWIFPDRPSIVRLVGTVLLEQNDEWMISQRYMSLEALRQAQSAVPSGDEPQEVNPALDGRLTA